MVHIIRNYSKLISISSCWKEGSFLGKNAMFPGRMHTEIPSLAVSHKEQQAHWKRLSAQDKPLCEGSEEDPSQYTQDLFPGNLPRNDRRERFYHTTEW